MYFSYLNEHVCANIQYFAAVFHLHSAGYAERMADDRLPKRAAELREGQEETREVNAEMGGQC